MNKKIVRELYRLVISSFGIILLGLSINYLSWRYRLVSGGFPGYALDINYVLHFPVGMTLLIANTIVLLLSFVIAGKTAGLRGVYGYVLVSFFIDSSKNFLHIQQVAHEPLVSYMFFTITQGTSAALAIALVMANGYSFGSYSSIMPIVRKFSRISAPKFFLLMDTVLGILTFALFGLQRAVLMYINAAVFFVVFRLALPFAEAHFAVRDVVEGRKS